MAGGRNRGTDAATQQAQEQSFLLEQQRIDLERQAQEARAQEIALLEQQLSQQSEITSQQISALGELQTQTQEATASFASLLEEATQVQSRAAELATQESLRAQAGEQRQQRQAAAGVTSAVQTADRRRRINRAGPTSLLLSEAERVSLGV